MAASSYARNYINSFRSEERLITDRNVLALQVKYRFEGYTGLCKRVSRLATRSNLWMPHRTTPLEILKPRKYLEGLEITFGQLTPVTAYDPQDEHNRVYEGDTDNLLLHVHKFKGPSHIRTQFAKAAAYIALHEELSSQTRVLCATHPALARLALRAGFNKMVTTDAGTTYAHSISAYQRAYDAVNFSHRATPAEPNMLPTVVAMPVKDFVDAWHP